MCPARGGQARACSALSAWKPPAPWRARGQRRTPGLISLISSHAAARKIGRRAAAQLQRTRCGVAACRGAAVRPSAAAAGALCVVHRCTSPQCGQRARGGSLRSAMARHASLFTLALKAAGAGALEESRAHARASTLAHREPKARTPAPTPSSEAPMLAAPSPRRATPSPRCVTLSQKRSPKCVTLSPKRSPRCVTPSPRCVTLPLSMPAHVTAAAASSVASRSCRMPVRCSATEVTMKPRPCANGVCHQCTCRSWRRCSNAPRSAIAPKDAPPAEETGRRVWKRGRRERGRFCHQRTRCRLAASFEPLAAPR